MKKVVVIHLDAYEPTLGLEMMKAGDMPAFSELAGRSARFKLDHGPALRTGLSGEHVATGLTPSDANRWSAVHFNPNTYEIWQEGTSIIPFPAALPVRSVVFDTPYFDLEQAPNVDGIVSWGAHDPGVATMSHPNELLSEVVEKFGTYPAQKWLYGLTWNSVENAQQAGDKLSRAVSIRGEIAEWLLKERIHKWDLALISVSEAHSAIESLWHGIDTGHPLNNAPSAKIAGEGLRGVYKAIDKMLDRVTSSLEDTVVILFSMHGMGPNRGDPASFLLLAELLYRHTYGKPYFDREGESSVHLNQQVELPVSETWNAWIEKGFPNYKPHSHSSAWKLASSLTPKALKRLRRKVKRQKNAKQRFKINSATSKFYSSIEWMPATRYQRFWSKMSAFSLPSFYDGRVRINLKEREKNGVVPLDQYEAIREEIIRTVSECKDPISGQNVVAHVEYPEHKNPMELTETEADIVFVWSGAPTGFLHPRYGKIGPIPFRRTGGHTGGKGFAYVYGTDLSPDDYGTRSAYDVIATLPELFHLKEHVHISGTSLLTPKH